MKKMVLLFAAISCGIVLSAQNSPALPSALAPAKTETAVKPVDANHRQLAEKLLTVTKADENIKKVMNMVKSRQGAQLSRQLNAVQMQNADEIKKAVDAILEAELTWDKLKEPLVAIYVESFSAEELNALIKFYESPVGRKIVEKQPEIQAKSMEMMQKIFQQIMPKIIAATKELVEKQQSTLKTVKGAQAQTVPPVSATPAAPATPPQVK